MRSGVQVSSRPQGRHLRRPFPLCPLKGVARQAFKSLRAHKRRLLMAVFLIAVSSATLLVQWNNMVHPFKAVSDHLFPIIRLFYYFPIRLSDYSTIRLKTPFVPQKQPLLSPYFAEQFHQNPLPQPKIPPYLGPPQGHQPTLGARPLFVPRCSGPTIPRTLKKRVFRSGSTSVE